MSHVFKIAFLGGDLRQFYMVQELLQKGIHIAVYGLDLHGLTPNVYQCVSLKEAVCFCDTLLCPIPFTKDQKTISSSLPNTDLKIESFFAQLKPNHTIFGGCLPEELLAYCSQKNITCHDLMKIAPVSIKNAVATAEGSIAEAILRSKINLHQANCLVLGFGRCAKILADKLKGLSANVSVCARKEEDLAFAQAYGYHSISPSLLARELEQYHFIFNTIPSMILDEAMLSHVKKDIVIIDIASAPGGTNFEYCSHLGLNAALCLGLPGKYAAKSSAAILNHAIFDILEQNAS